MLGINTSKEGFLLDINDWNEDVAGKLAISNAIQLSNEHWEIIWFMRNYYLKFKHLPNARMFAKAIRNEFGMQKGNSRYLLKLFPDGPLKYTCKLAGLPKPPTCL